LEGNAGAAPGRVQATTRDWDRFLELAVGQANREH
jgi:hypothetical protein